MASQLQVTLANLKTPIAFKIKTQILTFNTKIKVK